LIYLPGSRSYNAYQELKQDFPIGSIDPYNIVVATNIQNSTFTSNYFTLEHSLIQNILLSNSKYLDTNSITSISYCQGKRINFTQAVAYKNVSSPLYDTQEASDYRGLTKGIMNVDQTATLIQIKTIVDPDSQAITNFIVEMRNLINSFTSTTTLNGNRIEGYLFGGYTTTYDLQVIVYNLVPTMIGVTISAVVILIAWNFGSLALTLRLMLSVGMSLCWTYGMLVSYCDNYKKLSKILLLINNMISLGICLSTRSRSKCICSFNTIN
jgi:predicted RND superfamily exporter protein